MVVVRAALCPNFLAIKKSRSPRLLPLKSAKKTKGHDPCRRESSTNLVLRKWRGNGIPRSRRGHCQPDGVRRSRFLSPSVEQDPARICEILIGLPEVNLLGVDDSRPVLEIHVECQMSRPGCPGCGVRAHLKDQRIVTLVDLPCFGKCTRLIWHKRRCGVPTPTARMEVGPRRTTGSPG